jgi:arylsulfatase A-like enzyme
MIGKSGLTAEPTTVHQPNTKGFDHFFGFVSHADARHYYPEFLWRDGKKVPYPDNHVREGETYSGDVLLADALAYLEANKDRPFFLHLAFQQPHLDLAVPAKWKEPFVGRWKEIPYASNPLYRGEPQPKATFAGMVTYLDYSVGRVLERLRELGIAERTVVFFASDNGAMDEFGWSRDAFQSSGPLRGATRDLYEGGIRVPFIAWWPKTIPAGKTSDHVSAFWDFAPTACELARIAPPADTDGISYLPALLGNGDRQRLHEYLYWEYYELAGLQAARKDDWKAVRLNMLLQPLRPLELYNLAVDPGETRNVAAEHPEVIAQMKNILRDAHRDVERFRIVPPR